MAPSVRIALLGLSCIAACSSEPTTAPAAPPPRFVAPQVAAAPPPRSAADSAQAQLLRAHNAVRAEVGTPPLAWSEPVAQSAKQYAERCKWGHSSTSYGENLYAASSGGSPDDVVTTWANEKKFYDRSSGKCVGGECGHYSQVVWSKTATVGCAKATCSTGSPMGGGSWVYWVCQYDPPGNYTGQRAY